MSLVKLNMQYDLFYGKESFSPFKSIYILFNKRTLALLFLHLKNSLGFLCVFALLRLCVEILRKHLMHRALVIFQRKGAKAQKIPETILDYV
jgi:hypothetical protein